MKPSYHRHDLWKILGLCLLGNLAPTFAHAGVKLEGGIDSVKARVDVLGVTATSQSKSFPTAGIALEEGFGKSVGVELGAFYVKPDTGELLHGFGLLEIRLGKMLDLGVGAALTHASSLGLSSTYVGVGGGLGLDLPLSPKLGFVLDARYWRGIESVTLDQIFLIGGLRFGRR